MSTHYTPEARDEAPHFATRDELLAALRNLVAACADVRPYQMGIANGARDDVHVFKRARAFIEAYNAARDIAASADI